MNIRYLFILLVCLLTTSVSATATEKEQTWDSSKTVIIEGDWNFPPYEYLDGEGVAKGFNVELMSTIMNRLHLKYVIRLKKWRVVLQDLKAGKANLVNMNYNNERAKIYKYGINIKYEPIYAVFRTGSKAVASVHNLNNLDIIVERGSISDELLKHYKITGHRHYVNNIGEGLRQLSLGLGDAVVCDYETARYYCRELELDNLNLVNIGLVPQEYSLAGSHEHLLDLVGSELIKMKEDGTYDDIHDKWFRPHHLSRTVKILYISFGILVVVTMILYVFNYLLRKKVKRAEGLLKTKNESLKVALNAQHESNKKVEYAIKSANLVLWEYDCVQQSFSSSNDEHKGATPQKMIDISLFMKITNPENDGKFMKIRKIIYNRVNESFEVNVRIQADDHKGMNFYTITGVPMEVDAETGLVKRYVGFRKDVTEFMRLSNRMNSYTQRINFVLMTSNILTWNYDLDTDIFMVYKEGIKRYHTLTSAEYVQRCEPDNRESAIANFAQMKTGEQKSFQTQRFLSLDPDGKNGRHYSINGIPQMDTDGKIISYFGICNDITSMIQTQQQLKAEMLKAQRADSLKSLFVTNMSHEIRTPLNAIVGFSNLLGTLDSVSERTQCISVINTNTSLLLNIVSDILDLSKMESGSMEVHNENLNLSTVIRSVYTSLKYISIKEKLDFLLVLPEQPSIICADRKRITQILSNFITNAFKYTETGYVKVGYTCMDDGVRLFVEDSGVGIPPASQDAVFNRFEKLNSFKQGAGLGLSICKFIVEMYQGKIGVDSEVGKGSTFWAWLPLKSQSE